MINNKLKFAACVLTAIFWLTLFYPATVKAQKRDFLTDEEIELVRDAQEIDLRIDVLTKAIDRRFLVLTNDQTQSKQVEKDSDKWGELPKGTRGALLWDIERILQKAIDDIDDVAEHKKTDEQIFPIAVYKLSDSCRVYIPKLKNQYDLSKDEKEKGSVTGAIDDCNQIIEASSKVQRVLTKDKKKKSKKNSD